MCTYNGERYLAEQLNSLAAQIRLPAELVVSDDGLSDRTISVVEEFKRRAPFPVRVVQNRVNVGYRRNFEQAIRMCEGNYIALCDQDDRWYPHKLARLVEVMSADDQIGGVFSDGDLIGEAAEATGQTLWDMVI